MNVGKTKAECVNDFVGSDKPHPNGRFEDITGWKMWEHGVKDSRLTVIKRVENYISPSGHKQAQWLCECSCEEHKKIVGTTAAIKNGQIKSCGCLAKEVSRQLLLGNDYGKKK